MRNTHHTGRWSVSILCAGLAGLIACSAPSPPTASQEASSSNVEPVGAGLEGPGFDLAAFSVIDLTHTYDENTLYWPTSPSSFKLEQLAFGETPAGFFYSANTLCTPEHGGTHLDAPIHFSADGWTADKIPVERLIGPGVVIDVSEKSGADPDYRLTRPDVEAWEAAHGPIPAGAIVMLRTGWGERWPDRKAYLGDDTPDDASNLHFPSYGQGAAQMLVEERSVSILGVDTASIDHGPSRDFIVHQIAGRANVPGLENVANLERLPATGTWIIALPMKIAKGSGGPTRIIALLPRS